MRICIITARFPPQRCGVGDYSFFLANALARSGQDVDVLTSVGDPIHELGSMPSTVRVHREIGRWDTGNLRSILSNIRALGPDVLLLQYAPTSFDPRGITLATNLIPALSRRNSHIRIISNLHELYVPFEPSLRAVAQGLWQRISIFLLTSASHGLIVTAGEWGRRLKHSGIDKPTRLIPVGSNVPVVPMTPSERIEIRSRYLGGNEGGVLLAGFGAMHDRDVPGVLYGLRRLKGRMPAKLVWIGGGTPARRVKEGIATAFRDLTLESGDVTWTGVLPHAEVSRLLSACDIMLLPFCDGITTRRTSAVAALQHGLPVLTTQSSATDSLFVHRENVYQVPVADRVSLADGLEELSEQPALREQIAKGGRDLYHRTFDWDVLAGQVLRFARSE